MPLTIKQALINLVDAAKALNGLISTEEEFLPLIEAFQARALEAKAVLTNNEKVREKKDAKVARRASLGAADGSNDAGVQVPGTSPGHDEAP